MTPIPSIFTIGHSTHSAGHFVDLLQKHGVTAVADVRSQPYSRANPHFNRTDLGWLLSGARVEYVFLGDELGARPKEREFYVDGRVSYELLAQAPSFKQGIDRILTGAVHYRVALLCAEKDPLTCHRAILVGRHLAELGYPPHHILSTGAVEDHDAALARLLREHRLVTQDLFRSRDELIEQAYLERERQIAYAPPPYAGLAPHELESQ
jgi:uncharacterized protein (DUF488 family)